MPEYKNTQIIVRFEPHLRLHAGACARELPAVFNAAKAPWINVDRASAEEIAEVVECCPSGALTYEFILN